MEKKLITVKLRELLEIYNTWFFKKALLGIVPEYTNYEVYVDRYNQGHTRIAYDHERVMFRNYLNLGVHFTIKEATEHETVWFTQSQWDTLQSSILKS